MDISAITNIISNLGFPIACVFALAWFGWYMVKHTNEINAKNMEQVQSRCKEREEKLHNQVINAMKEKSKFSTYEVHTYKKKEGEHYD